MAVTFCPIDFPYEFDNLHIVLERKDVGSERVELANERVIEAAPVGVVDAEVLHQIWPQRDGEGSLDRRCQTVAARPEKRKAKKKSEK